MSESIFVVERFGLRPHGRSYGVLKSHSMNAVRCVFAGEDGATYPVLSSTELSGFIPYSTNQAQSTGLFEFTQGTAGSLKRFFRIVRP